MTPIRNELEHPWPFSAYFVEESWHTLATVLSIAQQMFQSHMMYLCWTFFLYNGFKQVSVFTHMSALKLFHVQKCGRIPFHKPTCKIYNMSTLLNGRLVHEESFD
eukprot:scaffold2657_cov368-Pavlova_lutheri.AAC.10